MDAQAAQEAIAKAQTQVQKTEINGATPPSKEHEEVPITPVAEVKEEIKEAVKEEKTDDRFASKFAALSRKEKEMRMKDKEVSTKIAEIDEYKKEIEIAKADPLGYLEKKFGKSFDDLTAERLGKGGTTKDATKIAELEATVQKLLAKEEEKANKAHEDQQASVIHNFKNDIAYTIEQKKEQFPILFSQNGDFPLTGQTGTDLVYDVIDAYFIETGEVLPADQAFEAVEKRLETALEKILELQKVQGLLSKKTPEGARPSVSNPPTKSEKTLKNTQAASPSRVDTPLDDKRDFARSVELIRNKVRA